MSEWDGIAGIDAWTQKLAELLSEAADAARDNDVEARFSMAQRLTQFIQRSRPNTPGIQALDRIASKTSNDLMNQTIEERLAGINARSAELAAAGKQLAGITAEAKAAASSIRLEKARKAVDSITATVNSLKELKSTLDGDSNEELGQRVEDVLAALRGLRAQVDEAN